MKLEYIGIEIWKNTLLFYPKLFLAEIYGSGKLIQTNKRFVVKLRFFWWMTNGKRLGYDAVTEN